MFNIMDAISSLVDGVQQFFNLVIGFFDLVAQAFEAVYFLWDFINQLTAYVPGEVSAVVILSLLGSVGAFVMW